MTVRELPEWTRVYRSPVPFGEWTWGWSCRSGDHEEVAGGTGRSEEEARRYLVAHLDGRHPGWAGPVCGAEREGWGGGTVVCALPADHVEHRAETGARWTDAGVRRLDLADGVRELGEFYGLDAVVAEAVRQVFREEEKR